LFAAQILQYPLFQAIDASGDPVSGGLLYFYSAGTTSAKDAYSDSALTTPIANPYTLNSKGEYPGLIYLDGTYKINVTESDGTQVTGFPIDNYEGSGSSILDFTSLSDYSDFETAVSTIGATTTTLYIDTDSTISDNTTVPTTLDLYFYQGNTLSVAAGKTLTIKGCINPGAFTKFEGSGTTVLTGNTCTPVVYAEWWGAQAGDSTDDLAAFNSAFASQPSLTVQALPGTYNLSNTLEIYGSGKNLRGSGRLTTVFLADDGVDEAMQLGITATQAINCSISDLTVQLDDSTPDATEIGIRGFWYQDSLIQNVHVYSFFTGIQLRNKDTAGGQSYGMTIDNILMDWIEDTYVHLTDVNMVNIKGSQFGSSSESTLDADEMFLFERTATNVTIAGNIIYPFGTNAATNTSAFHWGAYTATNGTFNINTNQVKGCALSFEFDAAEDFVLTLVGNEIDSAGTLNSTNADALISGNMFGANITLDGAWTSAAVTGNVWRAGDIVDQVDSSTDMVWGTNSGAALSSDLLGLYQSTDTDHGGAGAALTTATTYTAELEGFVTMSTDCDGTDTAAIALEIPDDTVVAQDYCGNGEQAFIMGFVPRGQTWQVNATITGDPVHTIRWIPLN